jgi:deoxyribose-phosphate aldolase
MKSLREEIQAAIASPSNSPGRIDAAASTEVVHLMRAAESGSIQGSELARLIDHTLLKAEATAKDLEKVCAEARTHAFASVCVNSGRIAFVANLLAGSNVLPISVVGFPLGAMKSEAKAFETRRAIEAGAREIDMVLSVGSLKDGDFEAVESDILQVVHEAGPSVPVKVILETALLSRDEKIAACVIAKRAGAAFVKTSTGFGGGGASVEDIQLMRSVVGFKMGVKASGGVRTRQDALKLIAAGANRLGASASVAITTASGISGESGGY